MVTGLVLVKFKCRDQFTGGVVGGEQRVYVYGCRCLSNELEAHTRIVVMRQTEKLMSFRISEQEVGII